MKLSIRLNKQIDCNKLCQSIEKLISNFDSANGDIQDCVIVIDVVRPIESTNDTMLKLEHKCIT